ncbi:MAG: hypothetical protein FWG64_03375 [Firmicutes bacterium]|nr:hypothetical protein [Bacillota bacterium]
MENDAQITMFDETGQEKIYTMLCTKKIDNNIYMLVETEDSENPEAMEILFFKGVEEDANNKDMFLEQLNLHENNVNEVLSVFEDEIAELGIEIQ